MLPTKVRQPSSKKILEENVERKVDVEVVLPLPGARKDSGVYSP
jgi:hypothetical protein